MKILCLDPGDRWVGTALSDPLGIISTPYQTTELEDLETFLVATIPAHNISTIVVGYPQTLGGRISEQTQKVIDLTNQLKQKFSEIDGKTITWILWDERLSSKRAQQLEKGTTPEAKKREHSRAAAFILQSYLDHQAFKRSE